jgi:hypothetical protein
MEGTMLKKSLYLFAILSMFACSLNNIIKPRVQTDPEAEEQAVYAAILKVMTRGSPVVIDFHTATGMGSENLDQTFDYLKEQMGDKLTQELTDSFKSRNDQPYALAQDMQIGVEYTLISDTEMQELFNGEQDGWDVFYSRYPNSPGITTFSKVGFNADYTQALIYFGNQAHWLAGAGYYFLLEKTDGGWQIVDQVMAWIS